MNLSGSQIMKLRRYGIRVVVWGLVAFVGFKAYQSFQEARMEGQKNRQMREIEEQKSIATPAENAIIAALPEERKKGRAFVKADGQMFSVPRRYYYSLGMWLEWVKDGEFSGHVETDPTKKGDEGMRVMVHPQGVITTTRQDFDALFQQGVLIKQPSQRKGVDVYRKPAEKEWYIKDYYVLNDFKDINGKPPVIRCGPWSAKSDFGYCLVGVQVQSNIFLSVGELTAKHVNNLPEIYQAIMSVANQIEEIK
ncbi:hypothetical protein DTO96_100422 [Ephemeroptericola cinctiostellae]|uniref:Uncharacterized protein n=2 Tax=Ephemeroptericola cinctiostellae TaxID=2268024 RepID=A0A345D8M4_9BURK|nr:hypothetical protein DTO96_100422 [Ephemeroptericola cinctiostellae]